MQSCDNFYFVEDLSVVLMKNKTKLPALLAQLVECLLQGTGGHGFDRGP